MDRLNELLQTKLKPIVKKIDSEAYYPGEFLKLLGKEGFYKNEGLSEQQTFAKDINLIENASKICLTTGFTLWCHLAVINLIRKSDNSFLKNSILLDFENGMLLAGPGLSNAMKYYANIERIKLNARETKDGFMISGTLPAVSNLGDNHWFVVEAEVSDSRRIIALVPCYSERLTLKEKLGHLALDGSSTCTCIFDDVYIPKEYVISEEADKFIQQIRPFFILYQTALGLGVSSAALENYDSDLIKVMREQIYDVANSTNIASRLKDIVKLRLTMVDLALDSTSYEMLNSIGFGYMQNSDQSRRLRESHFFISLTPTVNHLKKMLVKLNG